jgi:poly(A) polymerase
MVPHIISSQLGPLEPLIKFGDGRRHKALWPHSKEVVAQTIVVPSQRWAALFHDVGKPETIRFNKTQNNGRISFHGHEARGAAIFRKWSIASGLWAVAEDERVEIEFLIGASGRLDGEEWSDHAIRVLDTEFGPRLPALIRFARADCTSRYPQNRREHQERLDLFERRLQEVRKLDEDRNVLPKGLGTEICQMLDRQPGTWLGKVMNDLRDRVLAGELPRCGEIDIYLTEVKKTQPT